MWVESLKNGKFKYFERYTDPLTEKWKKVSVTLDSDSNRANKEAIRLLSGKIDEKIKSINVSDITFKKLYEEYFINWSPTVKNSSLRGILPHDKRMLEKVGTNTLARNVNRRLIQKLVNEMMNEGYAYSYYNGYKKRFYAVLDFGVRMDYLKVNEASYVKAPKKVKTFEEIEEQKNNYLELSDIKTIIRALRSGMRVEHIANMVEIMAYTGLRYGETAALTFKEIDFKNETITINGTYDRSLKIKTTPKTDFSYRIVTIPNNVKKILIDQKENLDFTRSIKGKNFNPQDYVLFSANGTAIDLDTFNVVIRRAAEASGISKHLTSHVFRHSHIALLAELGIPLNAAMERVGHHDYKTTLNIYSHVTKKVKVDIVKKLNELL